MLNTAVIEQFLKVKIFPLSFTQIFQYDHFQPTRMLSFLKCHHLFGNSFS